MDIREVANRLKDVSETPTTDARLLLEYVADDLENAIKRRLRHEPVSKIIGHKGFWKTDFMTTPDVLDPRPDSEVMIETVLALCPGKDKDYRILDLGTGSGCLLFSILDEYPRSKGIGIDISKEALLVAEQNKKNRQANLILRDFMRPDWTKDLGRFDIIVSNPPYIPTADIENLAPDVRDYDPKLALDGGSDGLNAYRALAETVGEVMAPDARLFLEIGQGQESDVIEIFKRKGFVPLKTVRDYGGIERILVFQYHR